MSRLSFEHCTSLATSCRVEVLPTEYGHYVLVVMPHDDEASVCLWCSGREVREYLAAVACLQKYANGSKL